MFKTNTRWRLLDTLFLSPATSLETKMGGIELDCCVYNASGPRSGTAEALSNIGNSRAGAVLSKSATLVAQTGNPFPRYKEVSLGPVACAGSINSEGLPNKGIDYYLTPECIKTASGNNKPYIVSISGLSLNDNLEMLKKAANTQGVTAIELNLACPNIPGKPVIAYDFAQMKQILEAVEASGVFGLKKVGVKLAPYFDMPHYKNAAEILNKFPVSFVVCTNTIGNGLFVDAEAEQPLIAPKGGFGGLAGGYIKQVALANVRQMRLLLRDEIDVVGVGGVCSGRDAFELILCGATAVQVGTCHWSEGAKCFDRISAELEEFMAVKGYTSIDQFKGKLKPYDKALATKVDKNKTKTVASTANRSSSLFVSGLILCVAILVGLVFVLVLEGDTPTALKIKQLFEMMN